MNLRNPFQDPASMFRIGMLALLVAIALMWIGRAASTTFVDLLDGVRGFLAGISIACLIQAMRLRHLHRSR